MASPHSWQPSPAALSSRTHSPVRVSTLLLCLAAGLALLIALGLPGAAQAQARPVLYVDQDAAGSTHNGLSWATAYTTLQAALDVTNANGATDYEIWVAEGTYYPDMGGSRVDNSRTESFRISYDNVQIYGGFAGTETGRDERSWTAHSTILSGDIDGDGAPAGNAYHVLWLDGVTNEQITAATVLDGFTVTAGNANDIGLHGNGGGLYCSGSGHQCSPTLTNISISGNSASYGGGMYNSGGSGVSSPTLTNVTISGNTADYYGGGMYNYSYQGVSSPTLTDVTLSGNTAIAGGGMYNSGGSGVSSPTLTNVTISGNSVTNYGGGMYNNGYSGESSPTLTNVVISGNRAGTGSGMYNVGDSGVSSPVLTNVTISGNSAAYYGGGMYSQGFGGVSSPVLLNSVVWGNTASYSNIQIYSNNATINVSYSDVQGIDALNSNISVDPLFAAPVAASSAPTTTGDYRLHFGSPAIDAGTNAGCPADDLDGQARPIDGDANGAAVCDLGAYETPPLPYLRLSKEVTPAVVARGAVVTYTLVVSNAGALGDPAVLLTDTLPANATFGGWIENPGAIETGGEITWQGSLAPAAAVTFTFTATHSGGYGDVVTNTAAASGSQQTVNAAATFRTTTLLYVDQDAAGPTHDGLSWATAYTTVQDALDVTNANGATDYEIWVAEGTYYPDEGGARTDNDRAQSFSIVYDNVQVYGGFAGAETARDQRNWTAHPTVLSGDIDGNGTLANNIYHVLNLNGVTNEKITPATVLDGFTVTGGNADNSDRDHSGGGLYCGGHGSGHGCSPTLRNLTISGNSAVNNGGGMYNDGWSGESSPVLVNVTISGNSANHGGGIYNNGSTGGASSPLLMNVLISGNKSVYNGGGMYNNGSSSGVSSPVFTNVTISSNSASSGGGLYNYGAGGASSPVLLNSIVWGNTAGEGTQIYDNSATPNVSYSDVQGGQAGTGNLDADPLFAAPLNAAGAPATTGDYRLLPGSPAIDAGTNAGCPADDLDGQARPIDGDGDGSAICDLGAYEMSQTPYLRLSKEVTPAVVAHGAVVTYTLVVSNAGALADGAVLLTDTLPANVTFGGWIENPGAIETGGEITWQGSLAPAAAVTLTFTATHSGGYGYVVTNTAAASGSQQAISAAATFRTTPLFYVDQDASGPTHDGLSWATAYTTVQDALDVTNANGATDYEVWVAEGTYYPDEGAGHVDNSRDESFFITYDNVQVYGGFAGAETARDQRNWTAHPTVLSGDIDGNGTLANNVYHVLNLNGVTNEKITPATVLDGFTVTGGNADGSDWSGDGGGFFCGGHGSGHGCSPTLRNLSFSGNSANFGGGLYNSGSAGESSPTLINVTIRGNSANHGGGIYNDGAFGGIGMSSPTLINVTISGNRASTGGGMYNNGWSGASSPTLTNVTISGNRASTGGGIYNNGSDYGVSSPVLLNSIVWGNTASNGAQIYDNSATLSVSYSNVQGGYAGTGNLDLDPLFAATVTASSAPTTTGDYRLLPGSPAIDAGTNTDAPDKDIRSLPRPVNGVTDMGAYEAQGFSLAITGDAQTAAVGAAFAQPLSVQVSSAGSEPAGPGGAITFAPPSGGTPPSGPGLNVTAPFTLTTDDAGVVTATVTANGLAGSYGVTVTATGAVTPVVFSIANTPLYLTAGHDGSGSGSVTSTPGGIDCGSTCTAGYDLNTAVTLTAAAGTGSNFSGWSGACSGTGACTLTMTETEAVTATFTLNQYTVGVSADPAAGGNVSGGGTVNHGDTVTVAATAGAGYIFVNWTESGAEVSTDASYSFKAAGSRSLVAHFSYDSPLYVDAAAAGPLHDGLSWATACTTVQAALDMTNANGGTDYEIWVAEGTYYPDAGGSHVANSRSESFRIVYDNVQLYGGFAGTETQRDQRDWTAHPTVLSGDIDGDGTPANNAWHVLWLDGVTNEKLTAATVVDGFTVTAGNADGSDPHNSGGGVYCKGSGSGHACSPTLRNLTISGNSAAGSGGGLLNNGIGGESSPALVNVTVSGNQASHGGGMLNDGSGGGASSPTLTNVVISGNNAVYNGGAMYNNGSSGGAGSPVLTNVTLSGNRAGSGGGLYNYGTGGASSPVLRNSIVWGNRADSGGGLYNNNATPVASYSDVQNSQPGTAIINADPLFAASVSASSAPTTTGSYRLTIGSPAVDTGTNSGCPADDLDGRLRPIDGDGNGSAICDLGAYEMPQLPYLRLSKQVTPTLAATGAAVTYTLAVSNLGSLDDPAVWLTDTLPADVTFGAWVENPGAVETGGTITWQGSLAHGTALTFTFTAQYSNSSAVVNTVQASDAEQALRATAVFGPLNARLYVDKDAPGSTHNGTSWATACTTVQEALDIAGVTSATDYEIWVAEGTYYPDAGGSHVANSRDESFRIAHDNVQLYGGFAGTETQRDQRDWTAHPTVLSGDIDGDGTPANNAWHVLWLDGVTNEKLTAATVVDGFTVTAGNADGSDPHNSGGGVYCKGDGSGHACSPTLRNLIISGNAADGYGGGLYNDSRPDGESSPTLTNVTISGNSAYWGGGIYNDGYSGGESSPTLTDVTISDNVAARYGGGMYNDGSSSGKSIPTLTSVTISGNGATFGGGGMYNAGYSNGESRPVLTNVTISGNHVDGDGGGIYNDGHNNGVSSPELIDVAINGNSAGNGGGMYNAGYDNGESSPSLTNVLLSGNRADNCGGMYNEGYNGVSSPTLTNVTVSGNRATYNGGGMYNSGFNSGVSSPVLLNSIVWGNTATNEAQIYNSDATPDISYSDVQGGYAGTGNLDADPLFAAPITGTLAPTTTGDYRLLPGSPVIDMGTTAGAPATDIRGLPRPVNGTADMGAYEAQGFTLAITGGDAQTATAGAAFAQPLTVQVSSLGNEPVGPGSVVTFAPPPSGPGLSATAPFTLPTDAAGTVTTTVTANAHAGSYSVLVAAGSGITPAAFSLTNTPPSLTVSRSGSGSGSVMSTPAGIDCGSTCTAGFDLSTPVTLAASADTGSTFTGWSGACSGTGNCTVTMTANKAVTATFTLNQYTVAVSADPAAGGNVSGGGEYNHGDTVTVTATPNAGYTFVNWTEGGTEVSASASYSFTAGANRTLVAHFTLNQYTVGVSADPAAGGTVSGGGTVNHGQQVTVAAAPNAGYTFVNWTEGGTEVSTSASYSFTAGANRTLVAHFTLNQYTVNASADPAAGGSVSGGGTVNHGQQVTVAATPNAGYTFVNWTEGGTEVSTSASYSFTAGANRTLVAHFTLNQYTVNASADPAAGGSVSGGGTVNHGQQVTVAATPNAGYTFVNWAEGGTEVSASAGYSFTAGANRTLVAHFTRKEYTIVVSADPAAGGTVSGGGAANHGQQVTVTATANSGYAFVNWTEGGTQVSTEPAYTFNASGSRTLVAHFRLNQYTVVLNADPAAGGNVSGGGTVNHGQQVTVAATANAGYAFVNWTEGGTQVSTNAGYSFTAAGNRTLIAHFTRKEYTVAVSADPAAGGTAGGGGGYNQGEQVTVTAAANTGYTFINWTEGGAEVSTSATYSFTASGSRTLVAHFRLNQYTVVLNADPPAGGSVSGGGTVNHGEQVTVTAAANSGYTFVNWTEGGAEVSTSAGYSFTAAGSRTLVAHFTQLAQPLARNDAAGVLQGAAVDVPVLANDYDPAGKGLTVIAVTQPAHGAAAINNGGVSVRYTAPSDFYSEDSFTYTAQDANGLTSTAAVAIVIAPRNETDGAPQLAVVNPAVQNSARFTGSVATVQAELPAGFYTGTVAPTDILFLAYTPVLTPTEHTLTPPGALQFGGFQFALTAYLNGAPLHGVQFAQPVTLVIRYDGALLAGLQPETLQVFYWNGEGWSTDGVTIVDHDAANGTLTVALSHLSEFAFFAAAAPGADAVQVYLPIIGKE